MTDMSFKPGKTKKPAKPKAKAKTKAKASVANTATVAKTNARPTAKELTKTKRRRRNNIDGSMRGKLGIDTSKLDPSYHYRWAEDRPGRLNELTKQDDYDVVENSKEAHDSVGDGSEIRRPSGTHGMVLLRKPIEFFNEDQAAKKAGLDELDQQIKDGGKARDKLGDAHYTPGDGNSIGS